MNRPLIGFCGAFATCVGLELRFACWDHLKQPVLWILAGLLATVLLCRFSATALYGVLLSGVLCGFIFTATYTQYLVQPIKALSGDSIEAQAVVSDYPKVYEENQRVMLHVEPESLGLSRYRPKIKVIAYLPLTPEALLPGDYVNTTLAFYQGNISDGFAREEYYAADGCFVLAQTAKDNADEIIHFSTIRETKPPIWTLPMHMATKLKASIHKTLPLREAGLTAAVLFGDKQDLADADVLAMRKAGLSHVMAVSGMHIGFLVSFFMLVFGRKWGLILSFGVILFFIPMAGATPSVIRAGIMYMIAALGFCIGREKDSLNSLCVALLFLLILNPYSFNSLSLQLSFAATLGLILFSARMQAYFMHPFCRLGKYPVLILRFLMGSIACSLSAMVFTTPILLLSFGYVSVLAPLANLLVVSVVGLLFILGHLSAFLVLMVSASAPLCGAILKPIADYLLFVAQRIADLPFGLIYSDSTYGLVALICIYLAIGIMLFLHLKLKIRFVLIPLSGALVVCTMLGLQESAQTLTISYLPSGAGQSIMISGDNTCTLIDCGASGYRNAAQNVREYMYWHGITEIDTLILTAVDKTHARNVPELLETVPVNQIIVPNAIRESEIAHEIMAATQQHEIAVTTWTQIEKHVLTTSPFQSLSIIGGIDRKLVIQICTQDQSSLILHSLTQNMLEEFLKTNTMDADTIVLAEGNLENEDKLQSALSMLNPKEIILQSGYGDISKLLDYPVRNTLAEGEITIRTRVSDRFEKEGA